jgi:DNA-binding GntR family transcriptional regulator
MQARLSDYIRRDLTDRIGSSLGPPADLTLPALSSYYGVSFTPVREALRDLVVAGVLVKQNNGRVEINPGRKPSRGTAAAEETPRLPSRPARLEAALSAEVIIRSLRGEDDYLREEATADRFGVGRTVVRQALIRLAGQGLIVHVPRCGWRVRPFDPADLSAYLAVRETLELKALELSRSNLEEAVLRRMLAGNVADRRSPRLDNGLHRYLVDKSGNRYIRDFFSREGPYYSTLFDYAAPATHVVREMACQHREILQALIEKDWPRARRALAHHVRAQKPIVEELLRRFARSRPRTEPREDTAR